jgi:hypothetical protein
VAIYGSLPYEESVALVKKRIALNALNLEQEAKAFNRGYNWTTATQGSTLRTLTEPTTETSGTIPTSPDRLTSG